MADLDIARRSVRGSFVLFFGNFGATAIAAVASIVIARLLGPTAFGTYTLVLLIPSFLTSFLGFGVNAAVIRYSAYSIAQGRPDEARRFTLNAIRFLWLTGVAFTLLEYVLAGVLSSFLLHRPGLAPYVQLVSLTVLGSTFLTTITSAAIGWNQMSLSALSNAAQSLIKLALAPLLIVAGFGVTGALVGHMTSYVAAGIIGTAALYLARLRGAAGEGRFLADTRELLRFGLPLYAGSMVTSLAAYLVTFILAFIASNTVFGYYQAASNFVVPITLVSSALTNSLFPAFTSFDGIGGDVKLAFRHAYRFVAFLLTPIIFFILAAAGLLIHILYGASFGGSIPYLQLLAIAYLPIAFGYTVHPAFFNGFNRPRLTMLLLLGGAATLLVAAPLLSITAGMGVDGLIYATLLSFFVAWAVGTFLAERYMGARLDLKANGAILLASALSYLAAVLLPRVPSSNVLSLLADVVVFVVLYLTLAPFLGAVKLDDLDMMEHTFAGLGFVSKAVDLLLRYERSMISLRR